MTCWIIYAKESIRDGKDNAFDWMVESAKVFGLDAKVTFAEDYRLDCDALYYLGEKVESLPTCVLLRTYDFDLGDYFEDRGVKVFNNMDSLKLCQDKLKTFEVLKGFGVETINTISMDSYDALVSNLGTPFVIKDRFGSKGIGVHLVNSLSDFDLYKGQIEDCIFQPFIECGNSDIRVHVIGGEPIAWVRRYNPDDFRSNFSQGGFAEAVEVDDDLLDLAVTAAKAVGLEIAGIDILVTDKGYTVCEVNGISGFRTIFKVGGPSVPDYIFKMIGEYYE